MNQALSPETASPPRRDAHMPGEAAALPTAALRFSLALSTMGRTAELDRLFESLARQTYAAFDVILVDQNTDDRLAPLVEKWRRVLSIRHLRQPPGLCRARNTGARQATGDIIVFPDDDCVYRPHLLERLSVLFLEHPEWDVITSRPAGSAYYHRRGRRVTFRNVWKRGVEFGMFWRRETLRKTGGFDERMGLGSGSPYWAGDGTDVLIAALELGCHIEYCPSLEVEHLGPIGPMPHRHDTANRAYCYALGKGYVMRKHRYSTLQGLEQCLRPLGGMLLSVLRCRWTQANIYRQCMLGVYRGWRGYGA